MTTTVPSNLPKTYRRDPEKFSAIERKLVTTRNVIFGGIILFFIVTDFGAAENWEDGSLKSLLPHVVGITLLFVLVVFSFRRSIESQRRIWTSYELLVGPDSVLRRMNGLNELEVRRDEVKAIQQQKHGLILETFSARKNLAVPDSLAEFEEVYNRLTEWMPATEQKQAAWNQSPYLLPMVLVVELILFALFFVSNKSWLELGTGVPLLAGLVLCLVLIQRNSQLDQKTKRKMWLVILPVMGIVVRLALAIINWQ